MKNAVSGWVHGPKKKRKKSFITLSNYLNIQCVAKDEIDIQKSDSWEVIFSLNSLAVLEQNEEMAGNYRLSSVGCIFVVVFCLNSHDRKVKCVEVHCLKFEMTDF